MGRTKKYPKIEKSSGKNVVLVRFSREEIEDLNKDMKKYVIKSRNEYLKRKVLGLHMEYATKK